MKNIYRPTQSFVRKHKTAIAVTATVIVCAVISKKGMQQHDDFLKEHGLYEEFYAQVD